MSQCTSGGSGRWWWQSEMAADGLLSPKSPFVPMCKWLSHSPISQYCPSQPLSLSLSQPVVFGRCQSFPIPFTMLATVCCVWPHPQHR